MTLKLVSLSWVREDNLYIKAGLKVKILTGSYCISGMCTLCI